MVYKQVYSVYYSLDILFIIILHYYFTFIYIGLYSKLQGGNITHSKRKIKYIIYIVYYDMCIHFIQAYMFIII